MHDGNAVDLSRLSSDDNLRRTTGFRRVYASVIEGWIDADSAAVLRSRFEPFAMFTRPDPMRFDLPEKKKLVHEMTIPIRWGDMDAMGHVNNTIYFRYFEIVRIAWFDAIGTGPNPNGEGPVIVNAFANFIKQLEYPGTIIAKHYVANPGRTSFDTFMTLERDDDPGVVYSSGGAKTVWVDFKAQKSRPLPEWLRAKVGPEG